MKTCVKCDKEKDDEQFRYGKVTRTECRECHNLWRREAAKKHKEQGDKIKKKCTKCDVEKSGSAFAYGLNICKKCKSENDKEENHRSTDKDPPRTCSKCVKEQPATKFRYQSNICLECEKKRLYEWRKDNPDKFKNICKNYRSKSDYREKQNTYTKKRYDSDENYKLLILYRSRIRKYIRGGSKSGHEKYKEILGCSWDTLRKWLSQNMVEGMTWDNYGSVWHIDHTMPCSVFDFTEPENIKSCFNWSNLAPMFGLENISKSDKINMALVASYKIKARTFIEENLSEILTDSLPADLRESVKVCEFGVLDTKE